MGVPIPIEYGGNVLQLQAEIWGQKEENEALSRVETRSFKKPRVSEFVPNTRMPVAVHKEMKRRFFKTRLCEKFNLGNCLNGGRCVYAHGTGDIRKPLPHQRQEVVAREGHSDRTWNGERSMFKCRKFQYDGTCSYGDRCRFLHDVPKKLKGDSSWFRGSSDTIVFNAKGHHRDDSGPFITRTAVNSTCNATQPVIYKTRLCNKWQLTGACQFGKICAFAHGQAELRIYSNHTPAELKNLCKKTSPGSEVGRPSSSVIVTHVNQQISGLKCMFKWKGLGLEKINGIYADWIDEVPARHA